jgi:hypothetical protein
MGYNETVNNNIIEIYDKYRDNFDAMLRQYKNKCLICNSCTKIYTSYSDFFFKQLQLDLPRKDFKFF